MVSGEFEGTNGRPPGQIFRVPNRLLESCQNCGAFLRAFDLRGQPALSENLTLLQDLLVNLALRTLAVAAS